MNKTCSKCKVEKPATNEFFGPSKQTKDCLYGWCRECCRKASREYQHGCSKDPEWRAKQNERMAGYRKNTEYRVKQSEYNHMRWENDQIYRAKGLAKNSEWYRQNPDKACAKAAKRRHIKQGQLVFLTQDEKFQVEMLYKKARELGEDWQVDHIIPVSRGGTWHPDNLQIVLKSYNLKKHAKLESEFRPPLPFERYNI